MTTPIIFSIIAASEALKTLSLNAERARLYRGGKLLLIYCINMAMIKSIFKIFIILAVIIGVYVIFSQASISYISDHMYFDIYAGKDLIQHPWFYSLINNYGLSPEAGPFHMRQKAYFLVKKTYARFLQKNFAGYGEINLANVIKTLQNKEQYEIPQPFGLQDDFRSFVPFNIFLTQYPQYILFVIDISDIEHYMTRPKGAANSALDNSASDRIFILGFNSDKSLEDFEKKIKSHLALYAPVEKRVVLPDKSTFIETIADIDVFDFKDKVINEKRIRYWEDENKRVVLWKGKNYIFVSNSLEVNQDVISMCFSNLEDTEFKQVVYIELDAYGIEDIIMGEGDRKLEGCIKTELRMKN